jgi:hypothetical protein
MSSNASASWRRSDGHVSFAILVCRPFALMRPIAALIARSGARPRHDQHQLPQVAAQHAFVLAHVQRPAQARARTGDARGVDTRHQQVARLAAGLVLHALFVARTVAARESGAECRGVRRCLHHRAAGSRQLPGEPAAVFLLFAPFVLPLRRPLPLRKGLEDFHLDLQVVLHLHFFLLVQLVDQLRIHHDGHAGHDGRDGHAEEQRQARAQRPASRAPFRRGLRGHSRRRAPCAAA